MRGEKRDTFTQTRQSSKWITFWKEKHLLEVFMPEIFSESGEAASALRMQKIPALRLPSWLQAPSPGAALGPHDRAQEEELGGSLLREWEQFTWTS